MTHGLAAMIGVLMADTAIPTVTFCDLAKNPAAYFDKTVRLKAVYEIWTEGQYLTDALCPLLPDDRIGAGYAEKDTAQKEALQRTMAQIQGHEYRGRAEVTIVGALRNVVARHFYWYGALFEIASFESARPAVALYEGDLEVGRTYHAKATLYANGKVVIEPRLRLPMHHAGRIEWKDIRHVEGTGPQKWSAEAEFRVVSKEVVAMGPGRWNTTFYCELIRFG